MRKGLICMIVSAIFLMVSGCAWVTSDAVITKDKDGKVVESKYSRSVKGLSRDKESAQSWADADRTARSSGEQGVNGLQNQAVVDMRNESYRDFQVTTGEFSGLVLKPGEASSFSKAVSLGSYTFGVKFIDDRGHSREWSVNRMITKDTKHITLVEGKR